MDLNMVEASNKNSYPSTDLVIVPTNPSQPSNPKKKKLAIVQISNKLKATMGGPHKCKGRKSNKKFKSKVQWKLLKMDHKPCKRTY